MARTKAELEAQIKHLKSQVAQLQTCVAEGPTIGQRFSALIESAPLLAWTTSRQLRITEVAGGLHNASMIGLPLADLLAPSLHGADALAAAGAALQGSTAAFRCRLADLDVAGWVAPLYTASAKIAGVVGIAIDESGRRQAERESAHVLERCRSLLESYHQILCVHDFEGAISVVEGPVERVFGYSAGEIASMKFSDLLAPECRAVAAAWVQAISASFTPRCWESVGLTKTGKKIPLAIRARLLPHEGRPNSIEAVARDLSSEKAVANTWDGAEHIIRELNATLGAMRQTKPTPESYNRALRLSSQLLEMVSGEDGYVDVHKIVQQIASSLQGSLGRNIRFTTDLRADNAQVVGDEVQIYELLLNACSDACTMTQRGGEVVISTTSDNDALLIAISCSGSRKQAHRTEFRLPCATLGVRPSASLPGPRGKGAILVIDDEDVVRRVLSRMVRDLGYEVTSGSTAEALEFYSRASSTVDVVIVPAEACLQRLREINPQARGVVCGRDGESAGPGVEYLQKPYNQDTLDAVLRKALTRTATP